MREKALDPFAILAAVGVTDATAATPVSGGQDTAIWRVEHGGMVSALRVFRAEQARMCRHEQAAMRIAVAGGLPVPEVRAGGVWQERPVLLLSWCPGRTLLDVLQTQPWRIPALGLAFGRMQARIHAVSAATLHSHRGDWISWAGPDEMPLQEHLRALNPRMDALLHGDYHPLNVMADGARIAGVLDWPNALAGDPRADLARTFAILRYPPGLRVSRVERTAITLFLRCWWRGYQRAAGRVEGMGPFYAWAGAATVRDQEAKIGLPNSPIQWHDLDPLRRWTAEWKRRIAIL
jgi:aminoglycoside phosphotransferase (APT) family kinase protein